ncbi:hypothetical protein FNYG_15987 [Fusarium nygamai]|uniref:Putative aldehyde dehydrogenase FUS7 n=1 Tax=Gibberella nygamai TaxID=42673 RepID=A0A2K0TX29_GIBNY|nr:hypothetical protein FNYG_15987 [Fusarium nygamai]
MAFAEITGAGGQKIQVPTGLFIDNEFVPAAENATVDLENPATGAFLTKVSAAQPADVDELVLLNKLADLIERDGSDLASLEAVDGGLLYRDSMGLFVPQAADTCRYFAGWADKLDGDSLILPNGMAYTRREPFGVCAAIVPWNSPLMITSWKLGPALAAGNVLIIKTPELSTLYGQKLAQLIVEAGFPPGVINILCGLGPVAGQRLSEHPDIRKISFTGSNAVGRGILEIAAKTNLKKVTLELGGKGPSIVFSDADLENALNWTVAGITVNNGQICAAGSRIYVQDEVYDKFVAEFSKRSRQAVAGNPLLEGTTKRPVISGTQKKRVLEYIQKGKQQNQKFLHGDEPVPSEGHFIPNTAFSEVDPHAAIIREEIFGPVASIARFKTEAEVLALANDSKYGLAGAIFTQDIDKALRVSNSLKCGQVTVNMWGAVNANTAFGGFKESGIGRDLGKEALEGWTQVKCVKINIRDAKL